MQYVITTKHTQLALMLCVAVAGTAVEARADCHYVRGSIAETRIESNDPFGRLLGTVTGVLNGARWCSPRVRAPRIAVATSCAAPTCARFRSSSLVTSGTRP